MATRIYDILEVELQDGTVVEIRPLPIKRLRRFMDVIKRLGKMDEVKSEDAENDNVMVDIMLDAVSIVFEKKWPQYSSDRELLEEVIDVPTLMKICEVAGGLNFSGDADPNQVNPLGMI